MLRRSNVSPVERPDKRRLREVLSNSLDDVLRPVVGETHWVDSDPAIEEVVGADEAIDITEEEPFTGDRESHEDEIIGTKEENTEYAYQWATVQLVGNAVPLVLDARPTKKGETRQEIVEDLLDNAQSLLHVDGVLMDREFDSQHLLESISQRGLTYVVPKRMYTSEKA